MSEDIEAKVHARLSSSGASRWLKCPGSLAMGERVPQELRRGSTVYADEGTAAHAVLEICLRKGVRPNHDGVRGRIVFVFPGGGTSLLKPRAKPPADVPRGDLDSKGRRWFDVDEEMVEALCVVYDYVQERLAWCRSEFGDVELRLETSGPYLRERNDAFGTADVTIDAFPDYLEVVDLKYGKGVPVSPKGNVQIRNYVLVADEESFGYERYRCTVAQPRLSGSVGRASKDSSERDWGALGVGWEELTADEMREHREVIREGARCVDQADAAFHKATDEVAFSKWVELYLSADVDGCRFCDAKLNSCPAHETISRGLIEEDFPDDLEEMRPLGDLNPEELAHRWRMAPLLELMARAYREAAFKAYAAGVEVPGVKVVRATGRRQLKESVTLGTVEEALVSLLTEFGTELPEDFDAVDYLLTEQVLKSPRGLENAVKQFAPRGKKKLLAEQLLEGLTETPAGKLQLVEESAPGDAVRVSADDDFDDDAEMD